MNDTFIMYTPGHGIPFAPRFPDSIMYSDGRVLNRLNLWSSLYVGDAGKSSESIIMQGIQTSKTIINKIDEAVDLGLNFIISDFNNDDIDVRGGELHPVKQHVLSEQTTYVYIYKQP